MQSISRNSSSKPSSNSSLHSSSLDTDYSDWFEQTFGFKESQYQYEALRKQFRLEEDDTVLISLANGRRFHIGPFETPSMVELNYRLKELFKSQKEKMNANKDAATDTDADDPLPRSKSDDSTNRSGITSTPTNGRIFNESFSKEIKFSSKGIEFQHKIGDVMELHMDPNNSGAVFQAASQFNCLEMPDSSVTPNEGITGYEWDNTQGPTCALACSAGTLYRNYFVNEHGQGGKKGKQINCLDEVGKIMGNENEALWTMENGYLYPSTSDSLLHLKQKIDGGELMSGNAMNNLKVGVQWDTEVVHKEQQQQLNSKKTHCVTQVYCSAIPIDFSFGNVLKKYEPFAKLILDATYQATFAVAAVKALERNKRVDLYLTKVGGGVFGNESRWIVDAIQKCLIKYQEYPLNVYLVHYMSLDQAYSSLSLSEEPLPKKKKMTKEGRRRIQKCYLKNRSSLFVSFGIRIKKWCNSSRTGS